MGTEWDEPVDEPNEKPTTDETYEETARRWRNARMTTIVLEPAEEGWIATQRGVEVVGKGDTAADAAAAYCQQIDQKVR